MTVEFYHLIMSRTSKINPDLKLQFRPTDQIESLTNLDPITTDSVRWCDGRETVSSVTLQPCSHVRQRKLNDYWRGEDVYALGRSDLHDRGKSHRSRKLLHVISRQKEMNKKRVHAQSQQTQPVMWRGRGTVSPVISKLYPHARRGKLNGRLVWRERLTLLYVWTYMTETCDIIAGKPLSVISKEKTKNKKRGTSFFSTTLI